MQYRDHDRRCNKEAKQILQNGGRFETLSDPLSATESRSKERFLISNPETSLVSGLPLICVNIRKGGELGEGSLIWTREKIISAAALCNSRTQFSERYSKAYQYALRDGILEEICAHMIPLYEQWDIERIKGFSCLCKTRKEFRNRFPKARAAARVRRCMEEVCAHMPPRGTRRWTLEAVTLCALQCTKRSEFKSRFSSAYNKAHKLGWLDDVCSHMPIRRVSAMIQKDLALAIAA
jgi:hypothetical protein